MVSRIITLANYFDIILFYQIRELFYFIFFRDIGLVGSFKYHLCCER